MRIEPATLAPSVSARDVVDAAGRSRLLGELITYWRQFTATAFNPYRPEKHYMRGPGPAWRAKHMAASHGDGA